MYLLSRHLEVQQKLITEIKEVIGMNPSESVTYRQLQELKYMDLALKESMRVLPPIPSIGRLIDEDLVLGMNKQKSTRRMLFIYLFIPYILYIIISDDGQIIPANSHIYFHFFVTFKDPKYFTDPEKFDPERFAPENLARSKIHAFAYTPFSAGMRNCIGQKYALLATKAVVSKVLRNFELLRAGEDADIVYEIVTRSKNGLQMGLKPRIIGI